MPITIAPEPPDSPDAIALIADLDAVLDPLYAPEDRHGYDVTRLLQPGVRFVVVRVEGEPAGCGAIHLFPARDGDVAYGELKRMFVRPAFRGRGIGRRMIDELAAHAVANEVTVLRLETGIRQAEAISLYEKAGFRRIPPFGEYRESAVSLCYERREAAPA